MKTMTMSGTNKSNLVRQKVVNDTQQSTHFDLIVFDNYPFILSIFASDNTLVTNTTNTTNENDSLNSISNTKAYTILFEIKNIRIMKINLDENQNHILKFNF